MGFNSGFKGLIIPELFFFFLLATFLGKLKYNDALFLQDIVTYISPTCILYNSF